METLNKLDTKTKIKLGTIIILILFVASLFFSLKATPSSLFFPSKRIQEKMFLKFKPNPASQVEYLSFLLNTRLEELSSMINSNDHSHVLDSSLRYSSTAGNITQLIKDNELENQRERALNMFLSHQKVLQHLLDIYPKDFDTERKYVEDDVNYLSLYIEQLSKAATASR